MTTPRSEPIRRSGPETATSTSNEGTAEWTEVEAMLRSGPGTAWLSVQKEDGVHTRPLFVAWDGRSLIFATKSAAAKTSHLRTHPSVSVALDLGQAHLVAEGEAARLSGPEDLGRASRAMRAVYDWPTEVVGDQLDAPYAAPTSGGPPFEAWEIVPVRVHAFPTADQFEPTRFLF